jgi:hypothetical protein
LSMCVDYRAVNTCTVKNAYPLPNIQELLDYLQGASVFSTIDLSSAFHQIQLAPDDAPKTAFMTHKGLFEYVVLPLGLSNAPAILQQAMADIFGPHLHKFVLVYLDDILVFSKNYTQHMQHIKTVLETLRKHKYHCRLDKCHFLLNEVAYLGHVVNADGMKPDSTKLSVVRAWPTPAEIQRSSIFSRACFLFSSFHTGPCCACSAPPISFAQRCQMGMDCYTANCI